MYQLLGGLKDLIKRQSIVTDNAIFRLHYVFTTVLLVGCSIIITATQFLGSPIQCINDGAVPTDVINIYCWITTTFTMPQAHGGVIGQEVAHPGVASDFGDEKKYYAYYQWVCFVLFFQAILCYVPKWLWDMWEGGLMDTIVLGLNAIVLTEDEKNEKKKTLIDYMLKHIKQHNFYALRYFFCEALCLVNIIGQLYLMNTFLGGEFFSYGIDVVEASDLAQEDRIDPMIYVFPRVTKCTFHKFGASGTIQKHDSLCVLPLNIFNEKSYIFIWFWFIILAILLSLLLVYRVLIVAAPSIRPGLLHYRNKVVPKDAIDAICRKSSLGDWYVLYMLGRNLDPLIYREMIAELSKKIETAASNM